MITRPIIAVEVPARSLTLALRPVLERLALRPLPATSLAQAKLATPLLPVVALGQVAANIARAPAVRTAAERVSMS